MLGRGGVRDFSRRISNGITLIEIWDLTLYSKFTKTQRHVSAMLQNFEGGNTMIFDKLVMTSGDEKVNRKGKVVQEIENLT